MSHAPDLAPPSRARPARRDHAQPGAAPVPPHGDPFARAAWGAPLLAVVLAALLAALAPGWPDPRATIATSGGTLLALTVYGSTPFALADPVPAEIACDPDGVRMHAAAPPLPPITIVFAGPPGRLPPRPAARSLRLVVGTGPHEEIFVAAAGEVSYEAGGGRFAATLHDEAGQELIVAGRFACGGER